jgi:hypothetical protein
LDRLELERDAVHTPVCQLMGGMPPASSRLGAEKFDALIADDADAAPDPAPAAERAA